MPTPMIHPRPVTPGSTVAIVSTSSPVPAADLERLAAYFDKRGHHVKVMPHTQAASGYLAGRAEDRAADLLAAFADPDTALIVPATGGKGASQLLPHLDFDAIAASPKVFCALSDPSIIANALVARSRLAALHGPTGYDFSRDAVNQYTEDGFWRMVTRPVAGSRVDGDGWRVLRGAGTAVTGPVLGGHLGTVRSLLGTPYLPDLDGAVLVLEEVFVPWVQFDVALTHMRLAGVFDKISALLIGVPVDTPRADAPDDSLDALILRCVGGSFPVVTNAEFGHTERKFPLPLGLAVRLDLTDDVPALHYTEDLVTL